MALSRPSLTFARSFSTTPVAQTLSSVKQLERQHRYIPPYPYPRRVWYKQSNFGLYGTSRIQYGNTVSERTETKNRRKWFPHVNSKRLYSRALERFIRVKVQVRVMKTIDKVGGLDEYLLGEKAARIKELGMGGWALRWRLMRCAKVKERFRRERETLGVYDMLARARARERERERENQPTKKGLAKEEEREMEGEDGEPEEVLMQREAAIDSVLDADAEAERRGEGGGIEIGTAEEDEEEEEKKTKPIPRIRKER